MNIAFQTLANRYAKAFLDCFGAQLSRDDLKNMQLAKDYLNQHKQALYFLQLPAISKEKKIVLLNKMITKQFQLPDFFEKLYTLLVQDKREQLIVVVFVYLCQLYQKEHTIESFAIESSTGLSSKQLKKIQEFLAHKTGADIIYTYTINTSLIAGLRMQSDTHYWEYSVKKQLQTIRQELTQ